MLNARNDQKVVALAGGVGGAKLAHGLAELLPAGRLTVVVNTADDFEHLGLHISPDLDTVMYTLAGVNNPDTGWGLVGESWHFMEALERLGGETWFSLGDRDLATHVERTRRLRAGAALTAITADYCTRLGVSARIIPMTDDPVRTLVHGPEGQLAFQEYFVRLHCQPRVSGFEFAGIAAARPQPIFLAALEQADAIVLCPSNPYVSIDPILQLPGVRARLRARRAPLVAVSPIVGGEALKGPAAKMMRELNMEPSAQAVAEHYGDLLDGFVVDTLDADLAPGIEASGLAVRVANSIMYSLDDKIQLAAAVLDFAKSLSTASKPPIL
ncbi:MAG: 2-phospho-L-lactate transferase [Anaerolineales bacterium]